MRRAIQLIVTATLLAALTAATIGCSGNPGSQESAHRLEMASLAQMPANVQRAPVSVQEAYQFAVANPDVLEEIPCYCGCGGMGHKSNYDCYVASTSDGGQISFDPHALGCSICVDITQDAMRMLDQGKTVPEIFAYVDSAYARFGPPTPLDG